MKIDANLVIAELLEQNQKLAYEKATLTAQVKILLKEKEETNNGDTE